MQLVNPYNTNPSIFRNLTSEAGFFSRFGV